MEGEQRLCLGMYELQGDCFTSATCGSAYKYSAILVLLKRLSAILNLRILSDTIILKPENITTYCDVTTRRLEWNG